MIAELVPNWGKLTCEQKWLLAEEIQQELLVENETLRKEVEERYASRSILGGSKQIDHIRSLIENTERIMEEEHLPPRLAATAEGRIIVTTNIGDFAVLDAGGPPRAGPTPGSSS